MALNRVTAADNNVKIETILVSVSNKSGLSVLIPGLIDINPAIRIYSTGGTFREVKEILGEGADDTLQPVSAYTGQPEMQGGLVKTLNYKIYLGLLSETYNKAHGDDLARCGAIAFDMVVVNLYPFVQTIRKKGATAEDGRANIDIGGPCMLRASAKNYLRVASVCDPEDYESILREMRENNGSLSFSTRFSLAAKSFRHTGEYDTAIADYFARKEGESVSKLYTFIDSGKQHGN